MSKTNRTALDRSDLQPGELFEVAVKYLRGRVNYERVQSIPYTAMSKHLDQARDFLKYLGNPEKKYPIIHIAGTKGKGSTSAMMEAILREAGFKAGLYLSPHMQSITERFQIEGKQLERNEFGSAFMRFIERLESWERQHRKPPFAFTYFELLTLFAFDYFAKCKLEFGVIETGLGGTYDTTNICSPTITIITNIGFDHIEQLGPKLCDIAREKAGIIKNKIPLVSGVGIPEARDEIRCIAGEKKAPLYEIGTDFKCHSRGPVVGQSANPTFWSFDYRSDSKVLGKPVLEDVMHRLPGRHQSENASLAITAAKILASKGWKISDSAIREGLQKLKVPGRIEVIQTRPTIILDGSHNRAAVETLIETIRESFPASKKVLLFGTTIGKDTEGMLSAAIPFFDHIIFSSYSGNPRRFPPDALLAMAREIQRDYPGLAEKRVDLVRELKQAVRIARESLEKDDLLCVAGSFFFAAEAKELLSDEKIR